VDDAEASGVTRRPGRKSFVIPDLG